MSQFLPSATASFSDFDFISRMSQADGSRDRVLNINVGILGHVDSGKTSLVKALSTSLSTAALDKNPQSQQRGITLDLGFSSFTLNIPDRIRTLLTERGEEECYDMLQFTLVDCPGHSSLIRTIIGGAQIIDMIILVVDANKGIQTQTAECIVIGEITTDNIVIALNKIDMLPEEDRTERIEKISRRIHKTLSTSKFADVKIVPISAAVGGEKMAAMSSVVTNTTTKPFKSSVESLGVNDLIDEVINTISLPRRNPHAPFYFAIDHCFPIKGHGTVVTGTVLNGSVTINQTIEFPYIHEQRKVKSMQMFHKPIRSANQGDRLGICVTNLDSNQIERGIAAAPNSLPLVKNAVCLVKKIRYFRLPCKSDTKFHISIGHSTVLAHVTFFGGNDLNAKTSTDKESEEDFSSSVLQPVYEKSFPSIAFQKDVEYLLQDEILSTEDTMYGNESVQFALIQFQQPIYCPMNSLMIGSRLDNDTTDVSNLLSQQCRLCFYGPLKEVIHDQDINKLKIFYWKYKECEILKVTDARNGLCYEAIGWKLVTEGGSIHAFLGMKLSTQSGVLGNIVSPFGSDGN
jgi:selenocysteine-specific elongation factor